MAFLCVGGEKALVSPPLLIRHQSYWIRVSKKVQEPNSSVCVCVCVCVCEGLPTPISDSWMPSVSLRSPLNSTTLYAEMNQLPRVQDSVPKDYPLLQMPAPNPSYHLCF